jgi:hypothetical protein
MNITINRNQFVLGTAAIVLAMVLSFVLGAKTVEPEVVTVVEETTKYVEVIPEEDFDVSVLEEWGGDFSEGKIRMIGAWLYGQDNNGDPIVIDERNELWTLPNYNIAAEDFLLMWIADNHTEVVHDDIVMKVWVEKYEMMGEVG